MSYQPLPTHDPEEHLEQATLNARRRKHKTPRTRKRLILHLAAFAAIMWIAFAGARLLARRSFRTGWTHCSGQRNITSGDLPTHFTLPSGSKIPSIALGVWQAGKGEVGDAVKAALNAGYRHIDGAWIYRNEEEVGAAVAQSGVPREQLWLTSKLWNNYHAPADVEPILDDTLQKLGTDYLDLYLMHWPVAFQRHSNEIDQALTADPYPTWKALEALVEKGKVRNIGISNFNIPRIKNLTANPLKVRPAVNQVELSFWNPQPELLKWANDNALLLEAYSPLGSNKQVSDTLNAPEVKAIAEELCITPAQVIISWHIQRGTVVLPKSVHPDRVVENFHVVKLPEYAIESLEAAAASHPPRRSVNPSKGWGLDFDVFDDYPYESA